MSPDILQLDEELLVEWYGDQVRQDVFPGQSYSAWTLTTGDPTNGFYVLDKDPTNGFYVLDNSGKTIMLFRIEEGNIINGIYSPRNLSELLSFLPELGKVDSRLADYVATQLESAQISRELGDIEFKGEQDLIFKPYSSRLEKVLQNDFGKTEEAYQELLSHDLTSLLILEKSRYTGNLDDVVTIIQGEYAVISSEKGKKVANTFGLADCIGVVIYDKDNQVAAVAHIDGMTDAEPSIRNMLKDMGPLGGEKYEVRLFGGYKGSAKQFLAIMEGLRGYDATIVEADILENAQSRAIGISVDGQLFNNTFEDGDPYISDRIRMAGMRLNQPLKRHYYPE